MTIHLAIYWLLFLGMFPMSFMWLRSAYKIIVKKDYSYVALRKGVPPDNPEKYAIFSILINLIAGSVLVINILLIIIIAFNEEAWMTIAGSTLWMKIFAEFILSRHAHFKI